MKLNTLTRRLLFKGCAFAGRISLLTSLPVSAYAACSSDNSGVYMCSGQNATTVSIINNSAATIKTAPGFEVNSEKGDALSIRASGLIDYTDENKSYIRALSKNASGLFIESKDGVREKGAVTIKTNGEVLASAAGINVENYGSGGVVVSSASPITAIGLGSVGIFVRAGEKSNGVAVDARGKIQGRNYGIYISNEGHGDINVNSRAPVIATGPGAFDPGDLSGSGIYCYNGVGGGGVTIKADSVGQDGLNLSGIGVVNTGNGNTSITATGMIDGRKGGVGVGVTAKNQGRAKNLEISVESVIGSIGGIIAENFGSGDTSITSKGFVTSDTFNNLSPVENAGVSVKNGENARNISINARRASGVSYGIYAINDGIGRTSISVVDAAYAVGHAGLDGIVRDGYGIYAINDGSSIDINVLKSGHVYGFNSGIYVSGYKNIHEASIKIGQGGVVEGRAAGVIVALPPAGRSISITNAGTVQNASRLADARSILATGAPVELNNTGVIMGVVYLGDYKNTVNLYGGSVTGGIYTGNASSTVNWSGGSLNGIIKMGSGGGNILNVNGVSAMDMKGVVGLFAGRGPGNILNLSGVTYRGGTFGFENVGNGANLGIGWDNINLLNGTRWTLTGNLMMGYPVVNIDGSSTLYIGSGVNPVISGTTPVQINNAGTIDLTKSGEINRTLTVDGNYAGRDGILKLDAVLGGEGSPSDRLLIRGGVATGATGLTVHNVRGVGARTAGNGIEVVAATDGGSTSAGTFHLASPVQAGAYEYLLYRGGNTVGSKDNWYLRSQLEAAPGASFTPPSVAYRPGVVGQTVTPLLNLDYGFSMLGKFQDRAANMLGSVRQLEDGFGGIWGRTGGQDLDLSAGSRFSASEQTFFAQFGKDWMLTGTPGGVSTHAGVMVTIGSSSSTFTDGLRSINPILSTLTGSVETRAVSLGGYWTKYLKYGGYFDTVGQLSNYRNRYSDSYRGAASQNGFGLTFSEEFGQPLWLANTRLGVEPQAQLMYQYLNLGGFEDGVASISGNVTNALRGRIGFRVFTDSMENDAHISTVTPYISADIFHDFLSMGSTTVGGEAFDLSSAKTWYEFGVGISNTYGKAGSLNASVRYAHNFEGVTRRSIFGQVAYRYEW